MVFGYKFFPGMVGYMMTLWEKLWGNFNANLEDTRTPMQKMIERFQTLGSMISAITTNLRDMFDTFGIGESKVLDVLDAVAKGFNAIEQSLRAVEAAESAAAEEGANFIDKLNRVTSEIGLAIAVITTIISLFSKLFAGKTEAEKLADAIKDIKEEMGWLGEITDATAEKIAKLREAMGEAAVEARTLADMMKDTGINTNNYGQYLNRMIDSLNELVSAWKLAQDLGFGEFDIQQELEGLGKAFEEMIGYLQRIGKEGDAGILIFIKRLRELGITIKEVDDYVYGWLERAAKGLTDMITAVTGAGPQLEIAGNLLLSVFNAALAQGMSLLDALNLIADPLAALSAKYTELGLAGSGAIAELLKIQKVKEANEGLFEAISGLNEVLQALGNTGFLTAEDFSAMQSSVGEYFKQLTAAGLTSKEALAVLAPILANLEYYAKQYGFALDPATQALIDQAKEAGVYKEKAKTMAEVLEEGFGNICDRLDQIVKYFTGDNGILDNIDKFKKRGAWDEFNEGARDAIDNLDEVNRRMPKGPGRYDGGNGSAQFGMTNVGQTQLIKVHRGESIIPENISSVLRSFFGGMSTPAATGGQADMAQVTVEIDGMAVYKALVPIMRKGMGKYGDVEIQGGGVF
jgi:DNA-binding transcriptional MerR regulator